jgi:hypothetical protein
VRIEYRTYADKIGWGLVRIEHNQVVATEQFPDRAEADRRLEEYVVKARENAHVTTNVISDAVGTSAVVCGP